MTDRPVWWDWDVEISTHALKRMVDRDFTDLDLRRMLDVAVWVEPDEVAGRWSVMTRLRGRRWEIIVEPDARAHCVVVVTAYPIDS